MPNKISYSWKWVDKQLEIIGEKLEAIDKPTFVTGIPRGGLIPAVLASHKFNIPYIGFEAAKALPPSLRTQVVILDDIADSGKTLQQIKSYNFITATLACRYNTTSVPTYTGALISDDHWLVFPWEGAESEAIQDYLIK